ncbi:FN3 associated domain-containing protein [Carboxylicivirga linearis]|uniref:Chitobiase/beta-hexosaminidase C-terminal domain-containing protein n=1 Tax=Carboxylicivirga linearis TaxID=1628157 RepID=A0ABS5JPE2_9BACT|nr:FN3 associated domain-containing protein [Carboxylicivirga linearis]MBS2096699.1 chitobiase/beta-hexosaminidase C-terminal domain-containing protein [Carboxylicivirga linearis]
MRLQLLYILLLVLVFSSCGVNDRSLSVISFNIRYDNPGDGINSWDNRKGIAFSFLDKEKPDVIGFQEVLPRQLKHLQEHLKDYTSIAAGREDGKDAGEMTPIFFKKDKFELISSSHFWLSNTPDIPGSKNWGTHFPRIVTWVQLRNIENGYIFYVFNTHFSHISSFARNESSVLLLDKIQLLAGDAPVVVTGDFNATFNQVAYQTLTDHWIDHSALWDSRFENLTTDNETVTTFNGFNDNTEKMIIDHILVNGMFLVQSFRTYPIKKGDTFISDHFPIKAVLSFRLNEKLSDKEPRELIPSLQDPFFNTDGIAFAKKMSVPIVLPDNSANIYYTLDGSKPDTASLKYDEPIVLNKTTTITAFAFKKRKKPSNTITKTFIKRSNVECKVIDVSPNNDKLTDGLFDFLQDNKQGAIDLKNGWLKSDSSEVIMTCKLNRMTQISEVYLSHLSRPNLGILSPKSIEVSISKDNKNFEIFGSVSLVPSTDKGENQKSIELISGQQTGRYLKIRIVNPEISIDSIPSKLFIDEIVII